MCCHEAGKPVAVDGVIADTEVAVDVDAAEAADVEHWTKLGSYNDPTPSPNFEFPVFKAEEDDVEGIPDEITRLLEHEKRIIQPHLENLETVKLGLYKCNIKKG
ncbi:hypothetical protein KIW84_034569 [Lathyrus oleraceus]|uniref:Uncharacterized protein n=1 Tax=Pisum sativum TaxID=3888 RepID=A0A9D4Y1K4_PEA|nr:hypothetical protein KIW84_034569 [Pisum sativum]